MKTQQSLLLIIIGILCLTNVAVAQNSKEDKKAALADIVRKVVNSDDYFFAPRYANSSGGSFDVSTDYSIKIKKDSIYAYLPYYGNAQTSGNDVADGTINFTWTAFTYVVNQDKKGNYDIVITPDRKKIGTMNDVKSVTLKISLDGSASVQVLSTNRNPINFDGSIGNRY